ncbi:hypothetical protein H1R16_08975 [Marnyiella aurantia]|uniref:Uncharacterized protein n=1 Tax=Marnyiella aurantia TaxID=2758037 RepID=A0A7D7QJY8_9FLAO|nr:hypothetical protein [Marnyiella aurantia]MBA5246807.1 hypothetical protein [Marnyiella aurantia]MBP0612110.1 hypothetical protein [Marnyiella aurantia]QMS97845.1 hypothetical protein H1R16_08975 [Marnyiella aurantia]
MAVLLLYVPLFVFVVYKIISSAIQNAVKVTLTLLTFLVPVIGMIFSIAYLGLKVRGTRLQEN